MSKKIASLYAEIGADTSKFEAGTKKTKSALDQQAAAFAKFSADATRNAKSYVSYEAQKAKAIAATERAAAKLAKEEERAAKAAAKAAEARRKESLVLMPGLERGTKGIQEFARANAGLISVATMAAGAVVGLGVAFNKAVNELVVYGDQVQKIKTITGQSAEEVSRQIQLADDLRVSYEVLSKSLQFASKNGIDTSINGLIKLGEQYKQLPKGIQQTQFLMEKFGKQGVEMGKILSQTSETIRNIAANTPDGLILNDKDLQTIQEYNRNIDSLSDSFTALKMGITKDALPGIIDFTNGLQVYIDLQSQFFEAVKGGPKALLEFYSTFPERLHKSQQAIIDNTLAMRDGAEAAPELADGLEDVANTSKDAEQAARQLSNAYSGLLSAMFTIQKQNDTYEKTIAGIAKKDEELAAKKGELTLKMWEEQRAGKLTNDQYLDYVQRLDEITKAQEENSQARLDAAKENEKAAKQREYDLVQERLKADGIISSGEYEYLQNLAVSRGLVSRAAADQAIEESRAADAMVAAFEQTLPPMQRTLGVMQQIAGYNGMMVNFGVNFRTSGSLGNTYGTNGINYSQSFPSGQGQPMTIPGGSRDNGGPGIAGTPYMIGTGAQPEVFIPDTNGTFVPNADRLGNTYNIVVNNPKKETAENSIRSSLKKLSYIGVAS